MLGRCPRPFLQKVTSNSHLTQSHEDETPVLQPPHQIVIGFDLGSNANKSLHTQACESPRSVLDAHNLCFRAPHHQQSRSPRSPLSALGSSLSDHRQQPDGSGLSLKVFMKPEEEIAVDGNCHHSLLKNVRVAHGVEAYNTSTKSDGVASCKYDCLRILQKQKGNSCSRSSVCHRGRDKPYRKTTLSCDCEDEYDNDGEDDDDDEDIDVDSPKSIFSTASPILNSSMSDFPAVDFLSKCFLCRRHLALGKDIYMYRGDRAFCSQECRYQQIVVDERKERVPAAATCFSGAPSQHRSVRRATQAAIA
eukprot:c19523_g1_i1 orf=218-1135(-)